MPKFKVKVYESYCQVITVEADSKQEANDIVNGMDIYMKPEHYVSDSYRVDSIEEEE